MTPLKNMLPGLTDNATEFFVENDQIKVIQSGTIIPFSELSFETLSIIEVEMYKDNDVLIALFDLHPLNKFKRIEQFVQCRLGGLDFEADIKDGILQDGEYWECPKRGNCPHEGILCKLPVVNGKRLTNTEVKILQFSATEMKNEVIAEELNLPLGTFHKFKKGLYALLNIQTKQEGTLLSKFYNLL